MAKRIRKDFNYDYHDPQEPRHASLGRAARKAQPGDTLRIVSYNICFSRKIDQAVKLLSQNDNLNKADVLCLQEMDLSGVELIAKALEFDYVYYPAVFHPYHGKDFGNAILSKWPVIKDAKIILPKVPRQRLQRIAVSATISYNDKEITVICVHMKVFMLPIDRKKQIGDLLKYIPSSVKYCVIAGDFNTITAPGRKAIQEAFRNADFRLSNEDVGWTHQHWTLLNKKNFVDHIYIKGMEVVLDAAAKENPKAKSLTVQQLIDLRYIP